MSGVIDAISWMSEHMDDKGDRTPLPSGRPAKPDYVIEAERKEAEAWKVNCKVIEEELESEKLDTDYEHLDQACKDWLKSLKAVRAAYERWREERKEL